MADKRLTHLDDQGRAHMVDVSAKSDTVRRAVAECHVFMQASTRAQVMGGALKKGDALAVARLAGIQGAKRTADLIPLCHPVRLAKVRVQIEPSGACALRIEAEAVAFDRTGVEMEALTAVTAAGLALYDMVKGVDRSAYLQDVRLLSKEGGRSGSWVRSPEDGEADSVAEGAPA